MPRPKLLSRMTIRLPEELEQDLLAHADRRQCSLNEVVINALENECARLGTYQLDYYAQLRPLLLSGQGDNGGQISALSDTI